MILLFDNIDSFQLHPFSNYNFSILNTNSSIFASRPTETSIFSAVNSFISPFTSAPIVTSFPFEEFLETFSTRNNINSLFLHQSLHLLLIFLYLLLEQFDLTYSRTVTFTPKSTSIEAHSIPMTPPPTIIIEFGTYPFLMLHQMS